MCRRLARDVRRRAAPEKDIGPIPADHEPSRPRQRHARGTNPCSLFPTDLSTLPTFASRQGTHPTRMWGTGQASTTDPTCGQARKSRGKDLGTADDRPIRQVVQLLLKGEHNPERAVSGAGIMNVEAVARRVLAEFEEMPGMTLTLPQASRLFGLEEPRAGLWSTCWWAARTEMDQSGRDVSPAGLIRPSLALRPVDVRRLAEEHFGRLHHRFGQRRDAGGSTASGRSRSRPSRSPARLRRSARRRPGRRGRRRESVRSPGRESASSGRRSDRA